MGNQKLKWTAEEEEALLAGVTKHGPGKWKNILRDPDFAGQLSNRSNIDLKDKWRNLSVAPGIQGSKDKIRTPKIKAVAYHLNTVAAASNTPAPIANASPLPPLRRSISDLSIDDSGKESKNTPRYDGVIFKALSALAETDANGSDVSAIFNFIEQQGCDVPPHFRRVLSSRLRRLAQQGKVEKEQNFYKMNDYSMVKRTPHVARPKETGFKHRQANSQVLAASHELVGEASGTASYKLVEIENMIDGVKEAQEGVERVKELAQVSENILLLAEEMLNQCSLGEIVPLN